MVGEQGQCLPLRRNNGASWIKRQGWWDSHREGASQSQLSSKGEDASVSLAQAASWMEAPHSETVRIQGASPPGQQEGRWAVFMILGASFPKALAWYCWEAEMLSHGSSHNHLTLLKRQGGLKSPWKHQGLCVLIQPALGFTVTPFLWWVKSFNSRCKLDFLRIAGLLRALPISKDWDVPVGKTSPPPFFLSS